MKKERVKIDFHGKEIIIEAGHVARQANGAVVVKCGGTVVLVTAVFSDEKREDVDFLPLTVNYVEMTYAAGKIPGGFIKREGKPSDHETLISRLIDRPIRPLFPKGYNYDTQVIATVLSADQENDPAVLAILGASCALEISDIPFKGPIAGVRIGKVGDRILFNPTFKELEESECDIVVVGKGDSIVMVEGGAKEIPEEVLAELLYLAVDSIKPLLDAQLELKERLGKEKRPFIELDIDELFYEKVRFLVGDKLEDAYSTPVKKDRRKKIQSIYEDALNKLAGEEGFEKEMFDAVFEKLEREVMRRKLFEEGIRIDGRKPEEIRDVECSVGILPRTHGSALFRRGETQVLTVTTLGSSADEQKIESLLGESYKRFMLHYNFPPYCVGEVAPLRAPSRREIGHGALAERAILPLVPPEEEFPYTVRVVSDVLESNGSSSMATVCGASLSLMDAGVPIKKHVAGIAMGLVVSEDRTIILTDILGDEDRLGDMDFKVAGTREGITSFQMDVKIEGIKKEVLEKALIQAREARMKILDIMEETIPEPRKEISIYAPRIARLKIKPDRIRDLIGPSGRTIKKIIEETGVRIEIREDGVVEVIANSEDNLEKAVEMVNLVTQEPEVGKIYQGKVIRVADFGAFVEILGGNIGLVHISQVADEKVRNIRDYMKEGDEVLVKVIGFDELGRLRLSRKEALPPSERKQASRRKKVGKGGK